MRHNRLRAAKTYNFTDAYYIYGADGQQLAEYDAYGHLRSWQLGGFGFKKKTNAASYCYIKDCPSVTLRAGNRYYPCYGE